MRRHSSFTLSRPGLKSDHYVPVRLRIADTLTVLSGLPIVLAAIAVTVVSLGFAGPLGLGVIWRNQVAFYAYVLGVLLVASWTAWWTGVAALKAAFRLTGMMTREEAESFPLRAEKGRINPWPDSWQKPNPSS